MEKFSSAGPNEQKEKKSIFSMWTQKAAKKLVVDTKKVVVQEVKNAMDDKATLYIGIAQVVLFGLIIFGGGKGKVVSETFKPLATNMSVTINNYYGTLPPNFK